MARSRSDPDWRAFERLIARIEETLATSSSVVSSPDRIRCKVTGRLREVDAAIRDQSGNFTILECRNRKSRQDVTWVEQLVTKKKSLDATRLIAVSASGFSDGAHALANELGIELKTARDIDSDELSPMLNLDMVLFNRRCVSLDSVELRFASNHDWSPPAPGNCDAVLPADTDLTAPIFRNVDTGYRWSINDIWLQLQQATDPFAGVEKGAPPQVRTACFPYPGNVEVCFADRRHMLGDALLSVFLWIESEAVWKEGTAKVEYGASSEKGLHYLEFASEIERMPPPVSLQIQKDSPDCSNLRVVYRRACEKT